MAKKVLKDVKEEKTSRALTPAPARGVPAKRGGGGKIAGRGFENLEREDILLPRLKLLQAQSPEVTDELGKAGEIFLNLSNKSLGSKAVITPILHFRSRIKWNPKDEGGGIDCSAPNARTPREAKYAAECSACPHKEWDNEAEKKKDQQPKCTMYENFLVLVGDGTEAVILPMEKTKAKVAKKFYSMMAVKGGDMFDNTYELSTVKEINANDEPYFNYVVRDLGRKTDEKRRAACERFWQSLVDKDLTKNMEHPEEGGATAQTGDGEPAAAAGGKY